MNRVHERTKEMMGVPELTEAKIGELRNYFEPNDRFYKENHLQNVEIIDTEKTAPEQVAEFIISNLN